MSDFKFIRSMNLQLFAEGAGGEGGTSSDGATGVQAGAPDLQTGVNAQIPGAQQSGPDKNADFDSLIKGDYKEQFEKKVQDIVQRRLKSSKETVDRFNALAPTLEMLSRKYGVDASDIDALNSAIADDDTYYEEEAIQRGMTVQQLKEVRKMERENAELRRQVQEREQQEQAERDIANWMKQAEEASKVFPGLDLGVELQNPQFVDLLRNNIDLQTAYFAIHHRELVPQAMQFAAKKAAQNVTENVIANGARPQENGTHSQSSANYKGDVSKLTRAQREEIDRRVARGERIVL